MQSNHYKKLPLMLILSVLSMYTVMFLNVDEIGHIYFSLTRLYMSILMACPMTVLMLLLMPMMYPNKKANRFILFSSAGIFILTLILLRTQAFISDKQYMKAMIPHHSSAIMTSKRAGIKDRNVRKLADSIIVSQQAEILRMKFLIDTLDGKFSRGQ